MSFPSNDATLYIHVPHVDYLELNKLLLLLLLSFQFKIQKQVRAQGPRSVHLRE